MGTQRAAGRKNSNLRCCPVSDLNQRLQTIRKKFPGLPVHLDSIRHGSEEHYFLRCELPSEDWALQIYEDEYFRSIGAGKFEEWIILNLLRLLRRGIGNRQWPFPHRAFATTELEKQKEVRDLFFEPNSSHFSQKIFASTVATIGSEPKAGSFVESFLSRGIPLFEGYSDAEFHERLERAMLYHKAYFEMSITAKEAVVLIRHSIEDKCPGAFKSFLLCLEQIACSIYHQITTKALAEVLSALDPVSREYARIYHDPYPVFARRSLFYDPVLRSLFLGKPKRIRDICLVFLLGIDRSQEAMLACMNTIRGMLLIYPSWEIGVQQADRDRKRARLISLGDEAISIENDSSIMEPIEDSNYARSLPQYLEPLIPNKKDREAILRVATGQRHGLSPQKLSGLSRKYGPILRNAFSHWQGAN